MTELKGVKKVTKVESVDSIGKQIAFINSLAKDNALAKKFMANPEKVARENGIDKLDTDVCEAVVNHIASNIPFDEKTRTLIGSKNLKSIESLKSNVAILAEFAEYVEHVVHALETGVISKYRRAAEKIDSRNIARSSINKVIKSKI